MGSIGITCYRQFVRVDFRQRLLSESALGKRERGGVKLNNGQHNGNCQSKADAQYGASRFLPSFLIILLIAMFFHQFEDNRIVAAIFKGIRPAVVALIAVPTFNLAKRAQLNKWTIWIPVVSALLIWLLGVSPIWIIIAAGIGGYAWGRVKK